MALKNHVILNADGKPMKLSKREQMIANRNQQICNALGIEISITTLTTIIKKVSEQKFYTVPIADYLPVEVGNGAWGSQLTTYRSFSLGGHFEDGVINSGQNNGKMASADAGIDSLSIKIQNWAMANQWTLFELEQAAKAGSWDLVSAREEARKQIWDLGIQKIAFLGSDTDSNVLGLLNQSGITSNTSLITAATGAISAMSTDNLKLFCAGALAAYRANCNRSAWPTHFVIPESDWLGLAAPAAAAFPIKPTLALLEDAFKLMTRNNSFKILPAIYGDEAVNALDLNRYALYNADSKSLRMDIPVDYSSSLANSVDNFTFNNVGYGQYTGVLAYRPKEMLYFDYDA